MTIVTRYLVVLLVFSVAVLASLLWPDIVDNKNAYDDHIREHYEPFLYTTLNATKHMPASFASSSYGKKKNINDYLDRVPPPIEHVFDTRTKAVDDLYEALHLIRVPGPHALMETNRVESEIERDRLIERIMAEEVKKQLSESDLKSNSNYKSDIVDVDGEAADNKDNNIKMESKRNLFETNSVQLVKDILPTSAGATPKGGQTNINYEDLYSIFLKYSDKPLKSEELHLFNIPRIKASHHPSHGWQKFFIAVNLYNNEDVLPFLTSALVAFIEDELAPFFNIASSVVVSIYANPSADLTAPLIREFLVPYLQHAGVRTIFVTTKGACGGYLSRQWFHERIEWMTCVRNKAMEPLYEYGMRVFDIVDGTIGSKRTDVHSQQHEEEHKFGNAHDNYRENNDDDANNMVVLFFNDIYFRPKDITTLLESVPVQGSSSTTPFEFDGMISETMEEEPEELEKNKEQKETISVSTNDNTMKGKEKAQGTTFDLACGMDFFYTFYDTWVSRDRHGFPFLPWPPYSDDTFTQNEFAQSLISDASRLSDANAASQAARSAIPVKCCWNGVAAIRGNLFLQPAPEHRVYMSSNNNIKNKTSNNLIYTVNTLGVTSTNSKTAATTETAKSTQEQSVIQRSSGAIYDRVDHSTIMRELSYTYSQILVQRMIEDWGLWRGVHNYLSELHGRPVLAMDETWPASLEDAMMTLFTQEPWHSLLSSASSFEQVWLPSEEYSAELSSVVQIANSVASETTTGAVKDAKASFTSLISDALSAQVSPSRNLHSDTSRLAPEKDDSVYYRARYPALRFRNSYIPSYGASMRSETETNAETHAVPHNVCSSSECLLFCQDVMHAVITQRARLPVILMNPNVRVAYESEHFERITHKWMYTSPMHYRFFILLRKLKTFLDIFKLSNWFAPIKKNNNMFTNNANVIYTENSLVSSAKGNNANNKHNVNSVDSTARQHKHKWNTATSAFTHKEYEFHEKVGSILYKPINASNDWLLTRSKDDSVLQLDVSEYTQPSSSSLQASSNTEKARSDTKHNNKQEEMRFFYIPSLTFMSCFRPGDGKAAMLEPLHVLLRPCYLALSAFLLFILYRQKMPLFECARSSPKLGKRFEKNETPASLSTAFSRTNNNIQMNNNDIKSSQTDGQNGNVINHNLLATVRHRFMRNVDDESNKRNEYEVERAWPPIV